MDLSYTCIEVYKFEELGAKISQLHFFTEMTFRVDFTY